MKLGVVIPAHNAAATLAATLHSVLGQSRPAEQVIVVDDGSSDATAQVAGSFAGVEVLAQVQGGAAVARNAGRRALRTDIEAVLWLDADDELLPGSLAAQTAALCERPELEAAWGLCEIAHPPGVAEQDHAFFRQPGSRRLIQLGSILWRLSAVDRLGPMDPAWQPSEDHEYLFRARRHGIRFAEHAHVGLCYWRRPGSLSFGRLPDSRKLATLLSGRRPGA